MTLRQRTPLTPRVTCAHLDVSVRPPDVLLLLPRLLPRLLLAFLCKRQRRGQRSDAPTSRRRPSCGALTVRLAPGELLRQGVLTLLQLPLLLLQVLHVVAQDADLGLMLQDDTV